MFSNRKEVDNCNYEACEPISGECTSQNEVENDKEDSVVEKADLIIKKDMEHKEITREKENLKIGSPQYEKEF